MEKIGNDNIKVSIITVCLNSVKTIEQTIQSVIKQTYQNIEYIVIDGQSVDGTLEVINKYRDHIAICVSEPDEGIYDAMNKGIRMAAGDVIGIINSDDRYDVQTVEKVIQIFNEDEADVVYGDEMLLYDGGFAQRRVTGPLEALLYRMNLSHPTVFVKKEVYEKYGIFDTQYKIAADYDFLLRIYRQGVIMKECPGILAYFRMDGFSARNGIACADEARDVALKYLENKEKPQYIPLIDNEHMFRVKRFQIQDSMREVIEKYDKKVDKTSVERIYDKKRKIYIFGAGSIGREVHEFALRVGIETAGFVDNNEKKAGTKYLGKPIQRLADIEEENLMIIVAVLYGQKEIKEQLRLKGYVENKDFKLYEDFVKDIKEAVEKNDRESTVII